MRRQRASARLREGLGRYGAEGGARLQWVSLGRQPGGRTQVEVGGPLPWPASQARAAAGGARCFGLLFVCLSVCWLVGWPVGWVVRGDAVSGCGPLAEPRGLPGACSRGRLCVCLPACLLSVCLVFARFVVGSLLACWELGVWGGPLGLSPIGSAEAGASGVPLLVGLPCGLQVVGCGGGCSAGLLGLACAVCCSGAGWGLVPPFLGLCSAARRSRGSALPVRARVPPVPSCPVRFGE